MLHPPPQIPTAPLSSALPPKQTSGTPYLQVQLTEQIPALLPMQAAQSVQVIMARRLTPMPNMPAPVLGLVNQRSRVLWLVDLAHLLGLPPLSPDSRQYNAITLQHQENLLVLAVQSVKGVVRIVDRQIQPLQGKASPTIAPYLAGYVVQSSYATLVLNVDAVHHWSVAIGS